MKRWLVLGWAVVVAAGLAGCGSGTKNEIVPVQGTVTFADGSKLPVGTQLLFNPSEGGVGTASGTTAEDGSFEVTHTSGSKGAEVAKYTVQLRAPQGQDAAFYSLVQQDFYDPGVLTAEVKGGMAPLEFVVRKVK